MRVPCPLCGLRDVSEFTYDGDSAAASRPSARNKDMQAWVKFVFMRNNPSGKHREIWQHSGGCRQFIEVTRDVSNHKIYESKLFESARPLKGKAGKKTVKNK